MILNKTHKIRPRFLCHWLEIARKKILKQHSYYFPSVTLENDLNQTSLCLHLRSSTSSAKPSRSMLAMDRRAASSWKYEWYDRVVEMVIAKKWREKIKSPSEISFCYQGGPTLNISDQNCLWYYSMQWSPLCWF